MFFFFLHACGAGAVFFSNVKGYIKVMGASTYA